MGNSNKAGENSKAGEQYKSCRTTINLENSSKAVEQQ
jgi:hypothetical protein